MSSQEVERFVTKEDNCECYQVSKFGRHHENLGYEYVLCEKHELLRAHILRKWFHDSVAEKSCDEIGCSRPRCKHYLDFQKYYTEITDGTVPEWFYSEKIQPHMVGRWHSAK